jgi:hypothetical protein
MEPCKHDWHFIEGTERLQCRRCKAETGPRTYDQRVQNMLHDVTTMGSAWSKDGERIDPMSVYAPLPEFTFTIPKPNYNITFHRHENGVNGKEVGKLDFNGPELVFEGDAAESAKVFIDWVAQAFHGRLKEEREAGRQEALAQSEQEPVAYLCENAAGHRYFRWKKPSSMYKPIPLYKRKIEDDTGVTWGIDWGRAGNKSCATIIKRLPGGKIEVVAVEYEP